MHYITNPENVRKVSQLVITHSTKCNFMTVEFAVMHADFHVMKGKV